MTRVRSPVIIGTHSRQLTIGYRLSGFLDTQGRRLKRKKAVIGRRLHIRDIYDRAARLWLSVKRN